MITKYNAKHIVGILLNFSPEVGPVHSGHSRLLKHHSSGQLGKKKK